MSELPLRTFATYLRLPSGEMPRVSPRLASDAEMAMLYRWLDGTEAVRLPFPVTIRLEEFEGGPSAHSEVVLTVQVETMDHDTEGPDTPPFQYRVALQTLVPWVAVAPTAAPAQDSTLC